MGFGPFEEGVGDGEVRTVTEAVGNDGVDWEAEVELVGGVVVGIVFCSRYILGLNERTVMLELSNSLSIFARATMTENGILAWREIGKPSHYRRICGYDMTREGFSSSYELVYGYKGTGPDADVEGCVTPQ